MRIMPYLATAGRRGLVPLRWLARNPFWMLWGGCMAVALILLASDLAYDNNAAGLTWMPFLLLYATWTIKGMRDQRQAMDEADNLLDGIRALQIKTKRLNERWTRSMVRRSTQLQMKEEQVDKLMMGIASGKADVERVRVSFRKEGDDA